MAGPLQGMRVLDLTTVVLGPYCTQIMADMGADVIKVESPDGDSTRFIGAGRRPGMSGIFINLNRGKRSLVLDLKAPEGRAALLAVARGCDVFVHSMRSKAIDRLGLGYEVVAGVAPSIVYCSLTGYGRRGRYRDKPAYDDVIQAGCGLVFLQAEAAGAPQGSPKGLASPWGDGVQRKGGNTSAPQYVTTVVADKVTGLMGLSGILLALFHRSRTGQGQAVSVPMFETMASFVLAENICGRAFDPPLGPAIYGRLTASARKPYCTLDGYLSVIVYTDRQWINFLQVAGRADLAAEPRLSSFAARSANVDFAYGLIESIIATRTSGEWLESLEDADIPVMPVLSTDDLFTDPHLEEARMIERFATAGDGDVRLPRTPVELSGTPAGPLSEAPELGQHSRRILVEAGYPADEVDDLMARIASPAPLPA